MPESQTEWTDEEDGEEEEYGTESKKNEVNDGTADTKCESEEEQAKLNDREGLIRSLLDGFF